MQKPVYFKNKGEMVCGTLNLPAGRGRCPAVVYCHGFTADRNETRFLFARLARRLETAGIASLRIDFRGSGESGGRFEEMTPLEEVSDARAAIARLRADKRIDPGRVGIVGMSLGGLVAALVAGKEPGLKSVVLWGAIARPAKVVEGLAPKGAQREMEKHGFVDMGGLAVGRAFWQVARNLNPPAELAKSRAPVLIIHGTGDKTVPYVNSTDFLRAARARGIATKRLSIAGSNHGFWRCAWGQTVLDATVDWFEETLL
jgi:uncharacterized protein